MTTTATTRLKNNTPGKQPHDKTDDRRNRRIYYGTTPHTYGIARIQNTEYNTDMYECG